MNSGALSQVAAPNTNYATSFAAFQGGNASGVATAIKWTMGNWSPLNLLKQLPNPRFTQCFLVPPPLLPTCGNVNAIELLTTRSPDSIFQSFVQTFLGASNNNNSLMNFTGGLSFSNPVNVTGPNQILTITLPGFPITPFAVMTERFDPVAHVISAVTLLGHPLAGWRYWHVYSIGTNDVVIETGAYDQPGAGLIPGQIAVNWAGYYIFQGTVKKSWMKYLQFIKAAIGAPQGSHLNNSLGGISFRTFPPWNGPVLNGYWDYFGDFTNYILNNVCQATSCN
jgi:hypothetical protein